VLRARISADIARARKLIPLLSEPSYRRALRHGVAAAIEHEKAPFAHEFETIVDAGANRGQFSLVAARRFPRARIVCIEPLGGPAAAAGRVLRSHRDFSLIRAAVGAREGATDFYVTQSDDSSSLLRPTAAQLEAFPDTQVATSITVPVRTLDTLLEGQDLPPPALLKLDVQGGELNALQGAQSVLASFSSVLVECSFVQLYEGQALAGQVLSHLAERDFRMAAIYSPHLDRYGRIIQADMLFERMA